MNWILLLTVCGPLSVYDCISQVVSTHENLLLCDEERLKLSNIPKDGNWKVVKYECKLKDGAEV
tara:strand:- start:1778 stop:1969 length:192 start_codon:yes stop_codon:yes gene_type:complete